MSKREKIVIGVNRPKIAQIKQEVTDYLILLNKAKDSLKQLTDGNVIDLDMRKVDKYLNELTGFLNGEMSATAYNKHIEYNELKTLIEDVNQGKHNLKFISKGKVNDTEIEEAHTNYLRDKYTEEYLRLKEAVDVLNESSMYAIRSSVAFGRDEVVFDVNKFQSAKLMGSR